MRLCKCNTLIEILNSIQQMYAYVIVIVVHFWVLMYLLKDATGLWKWTSEHICLYGKSH